LGKTFAMSLLEGGQRSRIIVFALQFQGLSRSNRAATPNLQFRD
jgi:hypothetical protein